MPEHEPHCCGTLRGGTQKGLIAFSCKSCAITKFTGCCSFLAAGTLKAYWIRCRNLSGVSEDTFEALKSSIKVSNADGYLCHISSETTLPCPPWMTFAILTNPGGSLSSS